MSQPEMAVGELSRSSPDFEARGLSHPLMGWVLVTVLVVNVGGFRKGPEKWIATGYVAMFLAAGLLLDRVQRSLAGVGRATLLMVTQLRVYTARCARWFSEGLERSRRFIAKAPAVRSVQTTPPAAKKAWPTVNASQDDPR